VERRGRGKSKNKVRGETELKKRGKNPLKGNPDQSGDKGGREKKIQYRLRKKEKRSEKILPRRTLKRARRKKSKGSSM